MAKPLPQILPGHRSGKLTVVGPDNDPPAKGNWLVCSCDCGEQKTVRHSHIATGSVRSCGCLKRASMERFVKHGQARSGNKTPEYVQWQGMLRRCDLPSHASYKDYGGRGVTVCSRWRKSFPDFLADVGMSPGPGYSLDRFPDKNGNYEPGNVRWATWKEQAKNRRHTIFVEFDGRPMTISEVSDETGIRYMTLYKRHRAGRPLIP